MPSAYVCTEWRDQGKNFNFLCKILFISYKIPHAFKIGTLVFQVWYYLKVNKDTPLLGFCYGFKKAFGVL
jgi:hypothetical protein